MSNKITVRSGKGELTLRKSTKLVGLKMEDEEQKIQEVAAEVLPEMGGFKVVTLKDRAGKGIDAALDEVRKDDKVKVGTHVWFAEGENKPIVPTGRLYIDFHDGVSEAEQDMALGEYKLELIERRRPDLVIACVTPDSPNPLSVAMALQNLSMVQTAVPDIDMPLDEYAFFSPRDPLLSHQWHLENQGMVADANFRLKRGADAKVVNAWERLNSTGSDDVTIAVIDNGFDLNHPDLRGKIVKPYNINSGGSWLPTGADNGSHGTPCCSVAAAAANGQGLVGAAPSAKLMPLHGLTFAIDKTERMFDHCINNGADVISCSWGTTSTRFSLHPLVEQAITKAATRGRNGKGCVVVFATGNDNLDRVNHYAAHPNVIAVGASTSSDEYAFYSNRGNEVTLVAPSDGGWPILAARASWDPGMYGKSGDYRFYVDGKSRGNDYKHFGGTSSATPLVAGICALILSANPDLTAAQVKQILIRTADRIGTPSSYNSFGHSTRFGYGRINADSAVAEALRLRDAAQPNIPPGGPGAGGTNQPPIIITPTPSHHADTDPHARSDRRWCHGG